MAHIRLECAAHIGGISFPPRSEGEIMNHEKMKDEAARKVLQGGVTGEDKGADEAIERPPDRVLKAFSERVSLRGISFHTSDPPPASKTSRGELCDVLFKHMEMAPYSFSARGSTRYFV